MHYLENRTEMDRRGNEDVLIEGEVSEAASLLAYSTESRWDVLNFPWWRERGVIVFAALDIAQRIKREQQTTNRRTDPCSRTPTACIHISSDRSHCSGRERERSDSNKHVHMYLLNTFDHSEWVASTIDVERVDLSIGLAFDWLGIERLRREMSPIEKKYLQSERSGRSP